ncbi:KGGVGR-motif variant AAA ATPase [Sphingopyxis sp. LARHCG72]
MSGNRDGRILTFYSYKGGVGRSMALANVAFIAAMNNLRVLVMDWDLEAPGVGYYFKGLVEPQEAKALKTAPGILDIAWKWVEIIRGPEDQLALGEFVQRVETGEAFDDLARSLIDNEMNENGGRLDILRAGSDHVAGKLAYEEALSVFSWTTFFSKDAGGILLNALRRWAKANYDLVLIDSRTGLADVAGICTMQLPDEVALCFVLNRQNMEGIAQVAGAIRTKRSEEVKLRVVPMRLSSSGTSEEASARARARHDLTTTGGFSGDAFDEDFRLLGVNAAPNVPFYEALAPIMANDPLKDPLSQNYLQLASGLLRRDLTMPALFENWVERIRRRLQPRHATASYLLELQESVPERAMEEIAHLVESALDAQLEHDAELDDDYIAALAKAAVDIADEMGSFEALDILNQLADLLRARYLERGSQWRLPLVDTLIKILDQVGYVLADDEELSLLDELETLLAPDPTIATRLQRLRYRRRAARIHVLEREDNAIFQTLAEISQLIDGLDRHDLSPDQDAQRLAAEIDMHLLRGDAYASQEGERSNAERAIGEYLRGYERTVQLGADRAEFARLRYDFAVRLATRFPTRIGIGERANFSVEAARAGIGLSTASYLFVELAQPLLEFGDAQKLLEFVQVMLRPERLTAFANNQARLPRTVAPFLYTAGGIVELLARDRPPGWNDAVRNLGRVSATVARLAGRRRATISPRQGDPHLASGLRKMIEALSAAGDMPALAELTELEKVYSPRARGRDESGHGNAE